MSCLCGKPKCNKLYEKNISLKHTIEKASSNLLKHIYWDLWRSLFLFFCCNFFFFSAWKKWMKGRLPEMTEGGGGGVEGLPRGKQPVVERTELPGAQWAWEQTRDYNFKADPMLYANFFSYRKHQLLQKQSGSWSRTTLTLSGQIWKCSTNAGVQILTNIKNGFLEVLLSREIRAKEEVKSLAKSHVIDKWPHRGRTYL